MNTTILIIEVSSDYLHLGQGENVIALSRADWPLARDTIDKWLEEKAVGAIQDTPTPIASGWVERAEPYYAHNPTALYDDFVDVKLLNGQVLEGRMAHTLDWGPKLDRTITHWKLHNG